MGKKMKQIRSRINEFIDEKTSDLLYKVYTTRNTHNNTKAQMIQDVLDVAGIENTLLGPGTNRVAFLIDGYVFKFAMDSWGWKDNLNELASTKELQPYVIKTYESNGLINVCEYVTLMSTDEFEDRRVENIIKTTLSILSSSYLLGDVGYTPKNFTNWGYRENGDIVILDYAYIYRVENRDILCSHDGAVLEYNPMFTGMKCPECNSKYEFMDIRRRISTEFEADSANSVLDSAYKMTTSKMMVPTLNIDELEGNEEFLVRRSDVIKEEGAKAQQEQTKALNNQEITERDYFKGLGYDIETGEDESSSPLDNILEMMMRENNPQYYEEENNMEDEFDNEDETTDDKPVLMSFETEEGDNEEESVVMKIEEDEHPTLSFEEETIEKEEEQPSLSIREETEEPLVMSFGEETEEGEITINSGEEVSDEVINEKSEEGENEEKSDLMKIEVEKITGKEQERSIQIKVGDGGQGEFIINAENPNIPEALLRYQVKPEEVEEPTIDEGDNVPDGQLNITFEEDNSSGYIDDGVEEIREEVEHDFGGEDEGTPIHSEENEEVNKVVSTESDEPDEVIFDSLLDALDSPHAVMIPSRNYLGGNVINEPGQELDSGYVPKDNSKYDALAEEHGYGEEETYEEMQGRRTQWR